MLLLIVIYLVLVLLGTMDVGRLGVIPVIAGIR